MSPRKTVIVTKLGYLPKPSALPPEPGPYDLLAADLKRAGDRVLLFEANVGIQRIRIHLSERMNGTAFHVSPDKAKAGTFRAWLGAAVSGDAPVRQKKQLSEVEKQRLRNQVAWMRALKAKYAAEKALDATRPQA